LQAMHFSPSASSKRPPSPLKYHPLTTQLYYSK
jgi:hypothetical protein